MKARSDGQRLPDAWEDGRPADLDRRRPPTSVLSIRIPAEMLRTLSERARAEGKSASVFARELIEAGLASEHPGTPEELAKAFTRWAREITQKRR